MKSKKSSKLLPKLSLIIVNYRVSKLLLLCIESIRKDNPKTTFEIIIVENGHDDLSKKLKKYKFVKYIKSLNNLGFGAGNNLGVKHALGQYLFFLNPDTKITPRAIDNLVHFLDRNKKVGIVAPLLLDSNENAYELQGTEILTPGKAVFAYSFLNKFLSNNFISRKFWMKGWDKTKTCEVEVVPGTAFMIRSEIYKRVGGFDEKFFLYFEEYDLCKRVKEIGYKIFIVPAAKVIHFWGESTKKSKLNIDKIFNQSRFYYFKKHFGFLQAMIVSVLLDINKVHIILFITIILGALLRFDRLAESFSLIADQKWFYVSAEKALRGEIPLVGITSSQTWLHQGPLWTYMLALVLFVSGLNPLSGAYLTAILGLISILLIYKVGKEVSSAVGLFSAFLYATSPIIVHNDRFSYHTSPIPLVVILLIFSLIKWVGGRVVYFPIALFAMSILYNLELATVVFWPVILTLLLYGTIKKELYVKVLFNVWYMLLSLFMMAVPMIPIIIYDISHGFLQTAKYAHWTIYFRILKPILEGNLSSGGSWQALMFLLQKFQDMYIIKSQLLSIPIILFSLINLIREFRTKRQILVIALCTLIPVFGFIFNGVSSNAYLPMLFPGIILTSGIFLDKLLKMKFIQLLIANKPLILIVVFGAFLRFFRIEQNFIFSAEIGDNLLAIKNAYAEGVLPLVGPPTSHHWLDFGPLFYWIYGPTLVLSNFDPLSHAYFGAFISVATILVAYFVVSGIVNTRVGILSSFLTAISFHFIELSRVARFFSIIPLLVLVYIHFLEQIARGRDKFFFLGLVFGIMINFHYSVLFFIPFTISYLFIRKKDSLKLIYKSFFGALIPLLPLMFYDVTHGFEMTLKLVIWIPYRILGFMGLYPKNTISSYAISESTSGAFEFFRSILFPDPQILLGSGFVIGVFAFLLIKTLNALSHKNYSSIYLFLFIWFISGIVALLVHGSVPNHYYLPIVPIPIILFALLLNDIWEKGARIISISILLLVFAVNITFFFSKAWFYKVDKEANIANIPFSLQKKVVKTIIEDSRAKRYVLRRVGPLDFFENEYSQNYIYLLWLEGNEPVSQSKLTYFIVEENYPSDLLKDTKKIVQISNIAIYKINK